MRHYTSVFFEGNAPGLGNAVFTGDNIATIYFLAEKSGWSPTFGGRPTALWKPRVQTTGDKFGIQANQFGFNINWTSGQVIVVEASTSLTNTVWFSVATNVVADGISYFSDPQTTNYPIRFYRLRSP